MTDNIYIIDERATKRARRIMLAMEDLKDRGKTRTKRYKDLKQELDFIKSGNKRKRPSGAAIGVPRT